MPAYTAPVTPRASSAPTSYDLSRHAPSTGRSASDTIIRISERMPASSFTSTVPKPYGSRRMESRETRSSSLRGALSNSLGNSASVSDKRSTSAAGLAKTYAPSRRNHGSRRTASRSPEQVAVNPGASRRERMSELRLATATRNAEEARNKAPDTRRRQERDPAGDSTERTLRRIRKQYAQAAQADKSLRKRMQAVSQAISRGTDAAFRAVSGTATGDRGQSDGDWDGHWNDPHHGYSHWYWNSFFPNWWFSHWGWGWGWGWGGGWGNQYAYGYSPFFYSGFGYGYNNFGGYFPTAAYYSPAVIYNTTVAPEPAPQEILVEEVTPQELPPAQGAPMPATPPRYAPGKGFGDRAAAEYMGLGDNAFTEGRFGDAVHYYAKSIQFAPQDGVLYLVLSDALFATGDYHYAAFALRRALELSPELASLGLDKRSFYGTPSEFDEQLQTLVQFVADHPIDVDARLVLAANFVFSQQPEAGLRTLDEDPRGTNPRSKAAQLLSAAGAGMMAK